MTVTALGRTSSERIRGSRVLHRGGECSRTTTRRAGGCTRNGLHEDWGSTPAAIANDILTQEDADRLRERFAFGWYLSRVRVRGPAGLLFADTAHVPPEEADPTAPGVVGEFSVYGTLFVVAPDADGDPGTLSDRLDREEYLTVALSDTERRSSGLEGGSRDDATPTVREGDRRGATE